MNRLKRTRTLTHQDMVDNFDYYTILDVRHLLNECVKINDQIEIKGLNIKSLLAKIDEFILAIDQEPNKKYSIWYYKDIKTMRFVNLIIREDQRIAVAYRINQDGYRTYGHESTQTAFVDENGKIGHAFIIKGSEFWLTKVRVLGDFRNPLAGLMLKFENNFIFVPFYEARNYEEIKQ